MPSCRRSCERYALSPVGAEGALDGFRSTQTMASAGDGSPDRHAAVDFPNFMPDAVRRVRNTSIEIIQYPLDPVAPPATLLRQVAALADTALDSIRQSKGAKAETVRQSRTRLPPYAPQQTIRGAFCQVKRGESNGLRSRERRFESCRGHCSEA